LNYFNYFTEIEDTFIRRRGKHLLLSSMDWALIESWKETGVPLHVALRGIERAFDSFEAKPRKRSVKSLLYCQEEVEAQYGEWLESQLGAGVEAETNGDGSSAGEATADTRLPFPRAVIIEHLQRARASLSKICDEHSRAGQLALCDALLRIIARLEDLEKDFAASLRPDAEKLEESLTSLEKMLDEALRASLAPQQLAALHAQAETQLRPYRNRMERATYEQTLDNLLLKHLREQFDVPRLSLFYL
jgi:hypothetical protein